jgi:hypothetical protein
MEDIIYSNLVGSIAVIVSAIVLIAIIISMVKHYIYMEDDLEILNYKQLVKRLAFTQKLLDKKLKKKFSYELKRAHFKMNKGDTDRYNNICTQAHRYSYRRNTIKLEIGLRY